jgi:transcriptional regulator with XRE-family HTH domain/quercetin dioxygenase-like cupin family protein
MPVYGSHPLAHDDFEIGRRLKAARQHRSLTLRQLAAATDISTAVLSQLENGRRSLDVARGLLIGDALGLPIEDILTADEVLPYQIVKDDELRSRQPRHVRLVSAADHALIHPDRFQPLADLFAGRHLEPVRGFVAAARGTRKRLFGCHHEQEFLLVLQGALEFDLQTPIGLERHRLGAGDSVYFWSNLPHAMRALDGREAETLQVFVSAPGSLSGTQSWLLSPRIDLPVDKAHRLTAIGRRVQLCRMAVGESVQNVAPLLGISARHLEQAEAGRRPLPMSAMVTLAQLSGYALREFIGDTRSRAPYAFVQRAADVKAIPPSHRRNATSPENLFRPLSRDFPSPLMSPYFIQVPTSDKVAKPHGHHGEEFIYVLSGQLELSVGTGRSLRREILRAGDSCYLDATAPHVLKGRPLNPYDRMSAEVIDLFWCPLGESYLFQA